MYIKVVVVVFGDMGISNIWVLYIFICKSPSTSTINHHFSYYECSFFCPIAFYRAKNVKNTTTFCSEPPLLKKHYVNHFLFSAFYVVMVKSCGCG